MVISESELSMKWGGVRGRGKGEGGEDVGWGWGDDSLHLNFKPYTVQGLTSSSTPDCAEAEQAVESLYTTTTTTVTATTIKHKGLTAPRTVPNMHSHVTTE